MIAVGFNTLELGKHINYELHSAVAFYWKKEKEEKKKECIKPLYMCKTLYKNDTSYIYIHEGYSGLDQNEIFFGFWQ